MEALVRYGTVPIRTVLYLEACNVTSIVFANEMLTFQLLKCNISALKWIRLHQYGIAGKVGTGR